MTFVLISYPREATKMESEELPRAIGYIFYPYLMFMNGLK